MLETTLEKRKQLKEHILVLRCQVGDEAAFAALYQGFGPRTLRYLEGLLGPEAAADVQQEVWLAVFKGVSRVDNPRGFRTWLYQITRHRAIDFLRKTKRERELLDAVVAAAGEEGEALPELEMGPDGIGSLMQALSGLSPPHREVLILRYWEEMSYAEMALVAGCSVGTIRSRLHHARRNLRQALGEGKDGSEASAGIQQARVQGGME